MRKNTLSFVFITVLAITAITACVKEPGKKAVVTPLPVTPGPVNITEEFDSANMLTGKGWVFTNNSTPVGQTGWRQGRYEPMPVYTYVNKKGGFTGPVPFLGFPAYAAKNSPQDFVSADITAMADPTGAGGNLSAWLISPPLLMKRGDTIAFFTRCIDDQFYPEPVKDRLQVWVNATDGSSNVGIEFSDTGSFRRKLLDINPNYSTSGYPRTWRKYTIVLDSALFGPTLTPKATRFAFRYYGVDAGFFGGSTGTNYPSMVGIDQVTFRQKK